MRVNSTWIPNGLTLANLFFGFTAMLAAVRGRFGLAATLIFVSMLLDMFDGRVARMLKRENPLGKDLDSFADLVSFGIAPGVIFYSAFLGQEPLYAIWPGTASSPTHVAFGAVAFIFPLMAALRLARFNTMAGSGDGFIGCPSPVAGGTATILVCFPDMTNVFFPGFIGRFDFQLPAEALIPLYLLIAVLMVVPVGFSKPVRVFLNPKTMRHPLGLGFNLVIVAGLILFFKFFLLLISFIYMSHAILGGLRREA